jgi:ribose transport system substrate-binding protein
MCRLRQVLVLSLVVLFAIGGLAFAGGQQEAEEEGGYVIGVSNGWVGSEWRNQMVDDVVQAAEKYKESGLVKEVIVQSTNVDVQGQINQVRNLMNAGADLILINPNAQSPFNPVIREAKERGVLVISTDQEVTSQDAINVVINQREWARTSAQWLAEQLNNEGRLVTINGVSGHPANEARVKGYHDVFDQHDGIEILNETNADWDQALGQQTANSLLATYPDLDGIWVQDGMAEGTLRALLSADREDEVTMVGEARVGFMKQWKEAGISTIGVPNPPGCMASAMKVGLLMLQGYELKDGVLEGTYENSLYLPIPEPVTNENLDEMLDEYGDKPDQWAIDDIISEEYALENWFKEKE